MADAVTKESEVIPIPAEQANPASSDAVKAEAKPAASTGEDGAAPAEQSKKGGELCLEFG
jgi:hypothetical protein